MEKNPFTLMYGITARSVVRRDEEIERVLKSFLYDENIFTFLITGIRGTGKTVLLKTLENELERQPGWIVVTINPQGDIIRSLANRLLKLEVVQNELKKWKISINIGLLSLTRENNTIENDPEIIVEDILNKLASIGIRVLISIDEVNETKSFKEFINLYQMLIGKDMRLYLLMTALKENVGGLTGDKSMTFLTRAPKIELEPLYLSNIALEYRETLHIDMDLAIEMAKLTNGYAFAFQVLGYLFFERKETTVNDNLIAAYDKYIWNNGYNKFWRELTDKEHQFLIGMAASKSKDRSDIIANSSMNPSMYSVYRERLLDRGLIQSVSFGKLDFTLPRFDIFIGVVKEFDR